ncbi:hypothetical protein FB451DRAFT_1194897 [Mycena latifolia]|nr:hypothetical protein FB451DRAFT_1194897 [Mycena latifolia]
MMQQHLKHGWGKSLGLTAEGEPPAAAQTPDSRAGNACDKPAVRASYTTHKQSFEYDINWVFYPAPVRRHCHSTAPGCKHNPRAIGAFNEYGGTGYSTKRPCGATVNRQHPDIHQIPEPARPSTGVVSLVTQYACKRFSIRIENNNTPFFLSSRNRRQHRVKHISGYKCKSGAIVVFDGCGVTINRQRPDINQSRSHWGLQRIRRHWIFDPAPVRRYCQSTAPGYTSNPGSSEAFDGRGTVSSVIRPRGRGETHARSHWPSTGTAPLVVHSTRPTPY